MNIEEAKEIYQQANTAIEHEIRNLHLLIKSSCETALDVAMVEQISDIAKARLEEDGYSVCEYHSYDYDRDTNVITFEISGWA